MRRFIPLLFLLPCATSAALAQRVVSGRVVAQGSNEPLPQATVRVEGQSTVAVTDKAGRFSLSVPTDATPLTISHLGYQSRTAPAAQLGPDVALAEQSYLIGEVQVSYVQLQKLLLRQWRIAPTSVDDAAHSLTVRARAQSGDKAAILEKNPDAVRRIMEKARYTFQPNGVVKSKLIIATQKLRWQLDEENRTLTLVNDEGTERKIDVVELTADRMVLKQAGSTTSPIAYVPAD